MLDLLRHIDTSLFLLINRHHSLVFDFLMLWASNRYVWIPFYVFLFYVLANKTESKNQLLIFILFTAGLITVSDQLSVLLFKDTFHRCRPCYNMNIADQIHLVAGCGGQYGFISSHASNVGALCIFLLLLFNKNISWLKFALLPWAFVICYSRVYLGVHYPADVICGLAFGGLLGFGFAKLFAPVSEKYS